MAISKPDWSEIGYGWGWLCLQFVFTIAGSHQEEFSCWLLCFAFASSHSLEGAQQRFIRALPSHLFQISPISGRISLSLSLAHSTFVRVPTTANKSVGGSRSIVVRQFCTVWIVFASHPSSFHCVYLINCLTSCDLKLKPLLLLLLLVLLVVGGLLVRGNIQLVEVSRRWRQKWLRWWWWRRR